MITWIPALLVGFLPAAPLPASQPASLPAEASQRQGNRLHASPNDVHALVRDEFPPGDHPPLLGSDPIGNGQLVDAKRTGAGTYMFTSREIRTPFPFNDVIPSWNIDAKRTGFFVLLRVGRVAEDFWSPWYYLGSWGWASDFANKHTQDGNGEVNIDYFQSTERFDRMQYEIRVRIEDSTLKTAPVIHRVALAYSNTLNDAELARRIRKDVGPGPKEKWARRLNVPYRSQKWEDPKIRGMICSPTSTSMVLEYRGVKKPTVEVCQKVWDPEYHLYGNWWRAVQTAYSFGVPGYIERFGDWNAVKRHIAEGQPVIASIKVSRGQLRDAPYRESNGHLLVITGFTDNGDVCINDPAAPDAEHGIATYPREDMDKVWLANGGVGYILENGKRSD